MDVRRVMELLDSTAHRIFRSTVRFWSEDYSGHGCGKGKDFFFSVLEAATRAYAVGVCWFIAAHKSDVRCVYDCI